MRVQGCDIVDRNAMVWLADLPRHWAKTDGDRIAMIFEGRRIRYADFAQGAARLCADWQSRGWQPGDRIGYFGRNSDLFYQVLFACALGRYVLASYNWRYAAPELAFVLQDSQPRVLFHDTDFASLVQEACAGLAAAPERVATEAADGTSLRRMLEEHRGNPARRRFALDDPLVLMYTSGTTGQPKGALVSHGALSLFRNAYPCTPHWENWRQEDVVLSAMPNFHIAGAAFVVIVFGVGATVVHTADPSPSSLIRLSNFHGVNRIFMVPTVVQMVLDELRTSGTPAPRYESIHYGASAISPALL